MNSFSLIIADIFEKSRKLAKAELAFMQAQIAPHFLHNTLNTIICLTRESPEEARNLLLKFSEYLRNKFDFNLYNRNSPVTFEHELEIVKSYLSIESVRFNGRLEVIYNIDERTLGANIMPFILQPLAENAVRHGLRTKSGDCRIVILSALDLDHAVISIEDNGVGIPKEKLLAINNKELSCSGTGIFNVDQRMRIAYGEGLKIISSVNKGTKIILKIPLEGGAGNDKSGAH